MIQETFKPRNETFYLTAADVADAFGVSDKTLYRLRNSNNGPPFFRIGQKSLYRMEDIERWIGNQTKAFIASSIQNNENSKQEESND